jgi:penicillin-binding protein 1C
LKLNKEKKTELKGRPKIVATNKLFYFLLGLCGIIAVGVWLFLRYSAYPQFDKLQEQQYSIRIYDRDGEIIQITSLEDGLRREYTPLQDIPLEVQKIFILSEDRRFYFHNGVDYFAALNALSQNYSSKRIVRGASTISMQLAKICEADSELTFRRKLSNMYNAYRIEARLSKKEILELYLNSVPFGMNACGVTSAARSFFGKELNQLTTEEILCLSVIPRRPASYNPVNNPKECAEMAALIAEKTNYIDCDFEKIYAVAQTAFNYHYPFYMPHYISWLKKSQPELFETSLSQDTSSQQNISSKLNTSPSRNTPSSRGISFLPKTSSRQPANYELHLPSSLKVQRESESFLRDALEQASNSRIYNGALLLLDNNDGSVLAWVGNADWFDSKNSGQIDGVLTKNQPGSSMKPFLYALAFDTLDDNGKPLYYPSKIIPDIPQEFGNTNIYIPGNFNNRFNGPVRTRIALASSLNIPAVSILNELGVDAYLEKLYQLGFESLRKNGKEADLGLALGAGEVSLYELTRAFSIFVRDGKDFSGNQIYSPDTARLICSILSDKGARSLGFGYSQTFQTDYPSIFKTGTSNQYQNITALGATNHYTIGVWMGNFKGQTVIGKTGSSLPAWVAKNMLDFLEKSPGGQNASAGQDTSSSAFKEPEGWTKKKICSLSGLLATDACPASVYEYVKNDFDLPECSWHNENQVTYPAEYQQWVRQNKISTIINYNSSPLELLTPRNRSVFFESGVKAIEQAIPVELIGGASDELTYIYDNKPAQSLSRPFVFKLPVEKGKHKCTFVCGKESISVEFVVK